MGCDLSGDYYSDDGVEAVAVETWASNGDALSNRTSQTFSGQIKPAETSTSGQQECSASYTGQQQQEFALGRPSLLSRKNARGGPPTLHPGIRS